MSGSGRPESAQAGFTLLELLIVVAIAGMLTTLAVSGFRSVDTGWRRIHDHSAAAEARAGLIFFLRNLLSQCYPFMSPGRDGKQALAFKGNSTEIEFLGPLPERFGTDDIVQYRLRFTPDQSLVLAWRFDRPYANNPGAGSWSEMIVANGLSGPGFYYFGSAGKADDAAWYTTWVRPDALPQLIDMRLSPQQGDDLIVAPAITAIFCNNDSRSQCPS